MSVKLVRKEMDMSGQVPQNAPANDAPVPPQMQQPQQEIPDHTHPEYDQMMVKLQDMESQLQGQAPGGINQESLDEGKPEDDKGKPTSAQQPIADNQGNWEPKKVESFIRKIIREELTGEPERDTGKTLDGAGPDSTNNIPQTKQPPVGTAPSGGGFDSDDKLNEEDGDDVIAKTTKPAEFDKLPIQKNKLRQAKQLIERAKALMKEANGEDPTKPNPGKTDEDPEKMDGAVPNKSPMGGTEAIVADPDEEEEDKEKPITAAEAVSRAFAKLKKEMANDVKSNRESFVGLTSKSSEASSAAQEEFLDTKKQVTNTVKEYLTKAGHSRALGFMVPPQRF